MRAIFFITALFVFVGCSSNNQQSETQSFEEPKDSLVEEKVKKDYGKITQLESGMSAKQVVEIMGEPTSVNTLSDEAEDWLYGENQKVRFVRDVVNRLVYDIEREQEIIKELLKAREVGDEEKSQELIKKLSNNDY